MPNIFSASKPVGNLAHNGFDLSRRDVFSAKCGMLTPCFIQDTFPDSKFVVDNVNIVRVDSIQSAPFARMSQNVEYFFVPYSQIWHDFERFYYERGEQQRNMNNINSLLVSSVVPTFRLDYLLEYLYTHYGLLRVYDYVVSKIKEDFAGDPALEPILTQVLNQFKRIIDGNITLSFGFGNYSISPIQDVHGRYCVEDILRIFDLLGYGNYLPSFKTFFAIIFNSGSDLYYDVQHLIQQLSTVPIVGNDVVGTWQSIASHIYQPEEIAQDMYGGFFTRLRREVSVFRLAAYLKVWSDYYRNSQYDNNINYAYYFNFDYVVNDEYHSIDIIKIVECLKPRYRQWKKDVFTGTFPSAQFGSIAVAATENPVTIKNSYIPQSPSSVLTNAGVGTNVSTVPGQLVVSNQNNNKWTIDSSVSALSIRQALAMQRYKERQLRAGNRLPANQRAVFGDKSRYIEDSYVDFVGAIHSSIDFNTVAATAESGTQFVGELSSNGISTHGGHAFQYHSHDFGVLIGLFYVLPEAEYENFGIDRFVTQTETFDFYKPDFANLGLSPVFNFDFNIQLTEAGTTGSGDNNPDKVLGYLARYWNYKTSLDRVHGEFYSQSPVSLKEDYVETLVDRGLQINVNNVDAVSIGAFAQYVTPRHVGTFELPVLSALYVSPDSVDRIFYASSDTHQSSDQFKVNMNHRVSAILPMSVIGLPQ